ncbi:hypothetical protein MesoLj113c_33300 [Mesorhizobium sp. 113-3-9]|uniref:COG3904 family protein n=1 Tax=Mesorhizobium sp. 113-3-9 TaxID=2744517 RepID=UPI001928BC99|nr:hypothetical protein [Mesorhizobium sp. 113-3-9]BCG87220.1 hypothetical protein MesoLj113c_33300 [Mesorhizobium sp. 113-3-9]
MVRIALLSAFCVSIAASLISLVAMASAAEKQQSPDEWPMNFTLVRNGDCTQTCVQWISAEGAITGDTDRRFKKFLKRLKGKKLPVVFQSPGGDVRAALAVGRMIRTAGLETAVGRTKLNGCPTLVPRCPEQIVENGWSQGEVHSGGAYCFSACPLAFMGGKVRAAAANARIGLHQITVNGYRGSEQTGRRDLDAISTQSDPELKQVLSSYLEDMGVSSHDVFAMMGLATPYGLYNVQSAEALKSGVITKVFSYSDDPGYIVSGTGMPLVAEPPAKNIVQ